MKQATPTLYFVSVQLAKLGHFT